MENVRLLVQEEGRAARNLIAFHVDISAPDSVKSLLKKPPTSPRIQSEVNMTKRSLTVSKSGSRVRSASTGRDKKSELHARYWAFLFGNLQRAVDEIYQTCETDESISECKEVIMILENFTRDFHNLIEWFKVKWDYESTPPPQRPTSLAWEVRKSSPGKFQIPMKAPIDPNAPSKRHLDFYADATLSGSNTDSLNVLQTNENETNRFGLCFGDVIFDENILFNKDITNCLDEKEIEKNEVINKNGKTNSDDKKNENNSEVVLVNGDVIISESKEGEVNATDQSSQTEPQKINCLADKRNIKTIAANPNVNKKPTVLLKISNKNHLNNAKHPLTVSMPRKTIPLSPTNTASVKNTLSGQYIPGRNVAATAFVPGKRFVPVQNKSIGISEKPTSVSQLKTTSQVKLSNEDKICAYPNLLVDDLTKNTEVNTSEKSQQCNISSTNSDNKDEKQSEHSLEIVSNSNESQTSQQSDCLENTLFTTEENIKLGNNTNVNLQLGLSEDQAKQDVNKKENSTQNKIVESNKQAITDDNVQKNINKSTSLKEDIKNHPMNLKTAVCNIKEANIIKANKGEAIRLSPTKQELPKVLCDKYVMTDFPALQPPQTLNQPLITIQSNLNKYNISRPTNTIKKTADTLTLSNKNSTITNSNKVCDGVSKKHDQNDKLAYSVVSKLYRSKTAIEIRSDKKFNPSNNVRIDNVSVVRNKETSDFEKSKYSATPRLYKSKTAIDMKSFGKTKPINNKYPATNRKVDQAFYKSSTELVSNKDIPRVEKDTNSKKEKVFSKEMHKDEDGWETVRVRSRGRLNPLSQSSGNIKFRGFTAASRFSLPSPATSLPALALHIDVQNDSYQKLNKDKQNLEIAKGLKSNEKNVPKKCKINDEYTIKRAKSKDDKGINKFKTLIADRKLAEKEKENNVIKKSNERIEKSKNDLLLKRNANQDLNDAMMDMMMVNNVEEQMLNEEELRKSMELYEEEKMLTKEIQDLESTELEEVDTETDETETDGEVTASTEDEDTGNRISALKVKYEEALKVTGMSWADQMETLDKLEELMAMDTSNLGSAWIDRLSTLEKLEELVARHPGRALELHQKLSSPSRRRTLPDTIQRYHARQASAKRKREQLLQDKSAKMRELLNKVEEVKAAQAQLVEDRKKRLEDKLKRAEENRASHLRNIQKKAHDEEEKLREIAFINELEAQNKRHDFMASCQEQQDRLQGILDERQRKLEEKAAKEAAVEERRRVLEAERQEKLEKMQERRRKREERIDREQQEKEKERLEMAREKARDREERLQALQAAQLANAEELQKKIQQKQEDSARRHEENIENIRQKALEAGALRGTTDDILPRLMPYETKKLCQVCAVLIDSEVYLLSHLRGKAHLEAVKEKHELDDVIIDAPPDKMDLRLRQEKERQKALRKRCKKIRGRMAQRGEEYLAKQSVIISKKLDSPNKGRLFKCLKEVDKLHCSQGIGQWPNNAITLLERSLAEINRILEKQNALDQKVFKDLNGFNTLLNILNLALDIPKNKISYLPPKCFLTTCTVFSSACVNNGENSRFVMLTNKIALVLDLLLCRLNLLIPENRQTLAEPSLPVDPVAGALMKLFAQILTNSCDNVTGEVPDLAPRLQDIVSYTVSVGVVDKLAIYCTSVRDPIDENQQVAQFLLSAIQLLTTLCEVKCGHGKGDPTQLVSTLKATELVGAVSMLYGMLLHQGSPQRDITTSPPALPSHTILVTKSTLNFLKAVALLDLKMFQSVLGAEGMSLELRHIASYLLWYCSVADEKDLLHQVVEAVGYFAVNHYENQMILQSGFMPTVLQQLCNLPFEYFSDPSLTSLLFPTLLACCHNNSDNRVILEQELSYQLLEDFRKSDKAQSNSIIKLIK
uniref:S phase cyclin A-associated protein in the endoplasmic reticulum N-terminal domain-containing protein n=1 Tax=Clastoptera arizonana TaxID=38151 RepID=A0A1B6E2L9_9HEMI